MKTASCCRWDRSIVFRSKRCSACSRPTMAGICWSRRCWPRRCFKRAGGGAPRGSLAVLRNKHGQRVPPNLQRFRSDDLLAAVFPAQAGCLENHHGDTEIPDHPLIHQTVEDCLHEAMDIDRWIELLADIRSGKVELIARDTREPSPFSHEILNANPYAFLDDAPLEERRARAVTLRRGLSFESASDLGRLDPEAIAQVRAEAWPLVRDAEELHDTLNSMCLLARRRSAGMDAAFRRIDGGQACFANRRSSLQAHSPFPIPHSAFATLTAIANRSHRSTCRYTSGRLPSAGRW